MSLTTHWTATHATGKRDTDNNQRMHYTTMPAEHLFVWCVDLSLWVGWIWLTDRQPDRQTATQTDYQTKHTEIETHTQSAKSKSPRGPFPGRGPLWGLTFCFGIVCLSVCLPACPLACLPACLPVGLCLSVCLAVCLSCLWIGSVSSRLYFTWLQTLHSVKWTLMYLNSFPMSSATSFVFSH